MNLVLFFCGGGMGICWVDGWNLIDIYWNCIYCVESWMFTEWLILICFWVEGWTIYIYIWRICCSGWGCFFFWYIYMVESGWHTPGFVANQHGIFDETFPGIRWNVEYTLVLVLTCDERAGSKSFPRSGVNPNNPTLADSMLEKFWRRPQDALLTIIKMEYKTWYMYGGFI